MSTELTDEQIREFLEDLGLPQVDPAAFRAGTLPELLRGSIDLGRIRPVLQTSGLISMNYSSGGVAIGASLNLQAPGPNEVIVARNMTIQLTSGNSDTVILQTRYDAATIHTLWLDLAAAPPHPAGMYIGSANEPTKAWGALNLDDIVLFGQNPDFSNLQQILQFSLQSAAAVDKTAVIRFSSNLYRWEDWPGN